MINDGVLFQTDLVTSTLTALTPVESGRNVVLSQPNPRFAGLTGYSDDLQYLTAHASASFGGTDPELYLPPQVLTGPEAHMTWFNQNILEPLVKQDTMVVKAFQDAGVNQEVNAILNIQYDLGKSLLYNQVPNPRGRRLVATGALTADTWGSIGTLRTDLKANKKYAICGVLGYSSDARAIRFLHPDFQGRTPTLRAHTDVVDGYEKFELCPVFSGDTDLSIEGWTGTGEVMTAIPVLGELK